MPVFATSDSWSNVLDDTEIFVLCEFGELRVLTRWLARVALRVVAARVKLSPTLSLSPAPMC